MADSSPYTKPHSPLPGSRSRIHPKPISRGKSCSGFIFKSIFLALFVVVLPLFPSQAPDFVSHSILTKFWELLHLLFIGIAVTYGLFSRRNADLETTHVETDSAPSYVSKMFPDSSIFGDGSENPCGFDEKRMMHCWNPQYFDGDSGVVCSNGGSTVGVFDEQYKPQVPASEDNFSYSVRFDGVNGTNVVQSWNSEYYHSEPVVVVSQPYHTNGESGEVVGHRPLGLPVRSLKGVAREVDGPKCTNESDSSSGSRGSFKSSDKSKDREFGDLGPSNLEKKFNAAATAVGGSASLISWRSRRRNVEREKRHGNVTRPSNFRPLSVDETKSGAFGSRHFQSTTSFSSHTSAYSSLDLTSSDNMNMNFQEEASYVPASEKMKFQEEDMVQKKNWYVPVSENMNFQEEDLGQKKNWYVPVSENMNFQEEDMGQMKNWYVPVSENMNFQEEDMGTSKTSYVSASGNTNLQEVDPGKKIFQGSSSRNRRMATKGKYAAVSYPSHLRPMSVDETQFESLSSESFPLPHMRSFSSNARMCCSLDSVSSDMDFQEEDMGQKKTFHMHTSQSMNFQEEDIGHKKSSYVHTSENMNFQQEDMEQKKTSYVHASENANFKVEDMEEKKTSYVPVSENANFQVEDMEQKKTSYVTVSENMNFQEVDFGKKISQVSSSRNGMTETKGKHAVVSQPSHFRPTAVDETRFESLSSRSFQSMGSFSSQTSLCSSLDSVLPENMSLLKEDLGEKKSSLKEDSGEKKSSRGSSSSSSSAPSARSYGETSSQPFQAREYNISSLLQDDTKSSLHEDLRGLNEIGGEKPSGNKESGIHALKTEPEKPASLAKALSRGKSVRTRRSSGLTLGPTRTEVSGKQTDEKIEKQPNNVESVLRKDKMRSEETDLLLKGISKKTLDSYCPKPEVTFFKQHKRDKPEPSKNISEEDSDIELENVKMSSDEDRVSECVTDSGLDSEVDKKASEFIAKFKAQIRLQKMGSIDRAKGQKIMGNNIR